MTNEHIYFLSFTRSVNATSNLCSRSVAMARLAASGDSMGHEEDANPLFPNPTLIPANQQPAKLNPSLDILPKTVQCTYYAFRARQHSHDKFLASQALSGFQLSYSQREGRAGIEPWSSYSARPWLLWLTLHKEWLKVVAFITGREKWRFYLKRQQWRIVRLFALMLG